MNFISIITVLVYGSGFIIGLYLVWLFAGFLTSLFRPIGQVPTNQKGNSHD